uniref:Uncharacterized protein n=1 Tax=Phytophthora ramorum TaxID=164328 RepID=H3GVX0_PHYRM
MDTGDLTYEETLERWALHDCSAVQGDRSADEMIALFNRWRSTRSKPVAARGTVTYRSMDRSWTSFVERWNIEGEEIFTQRLEQREATHSRLSVSALALEICETSYDADRKSCFVHFKTGCPRCRGFDLPRPSAEEWQRQVEEYPLTESERRLIGRFEASLHASRRGVAPRRPEDLPPLQGLPRTPPRSPECRQDGSHGAPSYPAWGQASEQDTGGDWGRGRRGDDHRDSDGRNEGQHGHHRLENGLDHVANITSTIDERSGAVPLKRRIADRTLRSRSVWIGWRVVWTCWRMRTRSCVAECRGANRRSGAKTGTLGSGSVVAGDKRGMVSPQPTDVESRMKPERCR